MLNQKVNYENFMLHKHKFVNFLSSHSKNRSFTLITANKPKISSFYQIPCIKSSHQIVPKRKVAKEHNNFDLQSVKHQINIYAADKEFATSMTKRYLTSALASLSMASFT